MKAPLVLASLIVLACVPVHAQCPLGRITSSDFAVGDAFGVSVAIDGALAVVGASSDDNGLGDDAGSAYVFALVAGTWIEIQKLTAPDGAVQDRFGYSVGLSGERILVGAYDDDDGGTNAGSAYLFDRTPAGWTLTTKLTASDPEDYDHFGGSASVSGDRLVIGARLEDQMGPDAGAAYVFELGPSGWAEVNKLVAADGTAGDHFGSSVGISGDWLIVGSPLDDIAQSDRGSAYIFGWSQFGWFLDQKLTALQGGQSDQFGDSVAIDGTTAVVGAQFSDANGVDTGLAYLFVRQSSWQQLADLGPVDPMPGDRFGSSVAVDGSLCLVGALGRDEGGSGSGAGFLFEDTGTGWMRTEEYSAIDSGTSDQLGVSASLSGEIALLGSPGHDPGGISNAGAVYYFRGTQLVVPYCLCGSGEPCGNPDDDAGCAHFAGSGSRLIACGTTRVSADDLVLTVSNAPPNQFGIVYMGNASMPAVPFGDGQRCVGGAQVYRFPVRFSGPQGAFDEGPGIVAFSTSNFPPSGHIDSGETWYFQGWFRDPLGPCGAGFNLSNALAVTFAP